VKVFWGRLRSRSIRRRGPHAALPPKPSSTAWSWTSSRFGVGPTAARSADPSSAVLALRSQFRVFPGRAFRVTGQAGGVFTGGSAGWFSRRSSGFSQGLTSRSRGRARRGPYPRSIEFSGFGVSLGVISGAPLS
jgi:hypothetical protein